MLVPLQPQSVVLVIHCDHREALFMRLQPPALVRSTPLRKAIGLRTSIMLARLSPVREPLPLALMLVYDMTRY